jgi:hypothetical protein
MEEHSGGKYICKIVQYAIEYDRIRDDKNHIIYRFVCVFYIVEIPITCRIAVRLQHIIEFFPFAFAFDGGGGKGVNRIEACEISHNPVGILCYTPLTSPTVLLRL